MQQSTPASDVGLGGRIARFVEEARRTPGDQSPPEGMKYGRLRVYCSQDAEEIAAAGATFSIIYPFNFTRARPLGMPREEFEATLAELRKFTDRAHELGITVTSYVSANTTTHREGVVEEAPLAQAWSDPSIWAVYEDFYGPRPEELPSEWFEKKPDGTYGGHVWIPPWATHERHYELAGSCHSPGFRQYMAGIMNILLAAGIDGIYLDHSEVTNPFSSNSSRCFREFLAARWSPEQLKRRFGIEDLAEVKPTDDQSDPLWSESILFATASGAEFHRFLRDHARQRDPDFIMSGNLYAAYSFQCAARDGSDIQLAGAVDTFLYSELASEDKNLPGTRDGARVSAAPLNRMITASSLTGAATTYTHYPNSPNPIPRREALYNIQRLAMAEAFANHCAFRRVEADHDEEVLNAARSVYALLKSVEPDMLGARMAANVGIVASLDNIYHRLYSYHLEVSRALADGGIAHEMLAPRNLTPDGLKSYRVVILPNTAVLTDEAYAVILDYEAQGGTVVAFGEIATVGRDGGPGPAARGDGKLHSPLIPLDERRAKRDGILDWDDVWVRHGAYARGEWPDTLRPTIEAVVRAVEDTIESKATARLLDSQGVEISVMQRPGSADLIVHLVNYSVDLDGSVTPASSVRVAIVPPDGRAISRVDWRALDGVSETLQTTTSNGLVEFTVPKLEIYGIAICRAAAE